MAGRHATGGRQPPPPRLPPPVIAAHHREIHQLLVDQKEMINTHTTLKNHLASLDEELRQLSATARELRAHRDAKVNELFDKSVKLEAQVRAIEDLNLEHTQVLADIERLKESKIQLVAKLKDVDDELNKVKLDDGSLVGVLKSDVENMKQEIVKGRAAVELEKKTRIANLEMSEAMEKKRSSMQHEIEMLRAELSNAEKRARAAVAAASNPNPGYMGDPGYMGNYGSRSTAYGGGPYSVQYSMHQGQLTADVPPPALYGRPGGPLDPQQPHVLHVPKG